MMKKYGEHERRRDGGGDERVDTKTTRTLQKRHECQVYLEGLVQLHAITDKKKGQGRAMKLMGADKSFLNLEIVAQLNIPINRDIKETVVMATGKPFKTKGISNGVDVILQSGQVRRDAGFRLVGNPRSNWLAFLSKRSMEFNIGGACYRLEVPPKRAVDHYITLIAGTRLISVRPYCYAQSQKTEIETQVTEMLKERLIRQSTSHLYSLVLFVKKERKNGLGDFVWTTEHPIRSGYHQIRMAEDDISKTSFRTHEGYYEFLVMPFGLSNVPSTFQSLMNSIFRTFFGIHTVYEVLSKHGLKVKKAKCFFGQDSIDYLGHHIFARSVEVDNMKIQCIMNWPKLTTATGLRGFLWNLLAITGSLFVALA
ncbi:unnamed protein product [Prunus armeniaca]